MCRQLRVAWAAAATGLGAARADSEANLSDLNTVATCQ